MARTVGGASKRPTRKARFATIVVFPKHIEMTMLGFTASDLEHVKSWCPMEWHKADQCWLLDRRDLAQVTEVLEELGFTVRQRDAR